MCLTVVLLFFLRVSLHGFCVFFYSKCVFFGTLLGSRAGFDSHRFRLVVGVNKHSAK